ncbi:MAG: cytochrome D1 domain-containing protein [Rhodoferax sp.]|nr:cytochrome D1 domain-containing protein [Rhodoferax sp.]
MSKSHCVLPGTVAFLLGFLGLIDELKRSLIAGILRLKTLYLIVGLLFSGTVNAMAQADVSLHGKSRLSPDRHYVYRGTDDGWVTKYDLRSSSLVAKVRAGLAMGNLAISGDGRWVMVANTEPHTLVLLDSDLKLVRSYPADAIGGKFSSATAKVHVAPARQSFVITFKDIAELWEVSYNSKAEPIFDGLVHDYRMGEAIGRPGFLGVRRTLLDEPLDDLFFDQDYRHVAGVTWLKADGGRIVHVVNLDIRRRVAVLTLPGVPQPGSALTCSWNGAAVFAIPNSENGVAHLIDTKKWQLVGQVPMPALLGQCKAVHQTGQADETSR